jgi:hypothetical protein
LKPTKKDMLAVLSSFIFGARQDAVSLSQPLPPSLGKIVGEIWELPQPPAVPSPPRTLPELLLQALNAKSFKELYTSLRRALANVSESDKEDVAESACGSNISFEEMVSFVLHLLDQWALIQTPENRWVLLAALVQIVRAVDAHVSLDGFVAVGSTGSERKEMGRVEICTHNGPVSGAQQQVHFLHGTTRKTAGISVEQNHKMRSKYVNLTWEEIVKLMLCLTSLPLEGRDPIVQRVLDGVFEFVWANKCGFFEFDGCEIVTAEPLAMGVNAFVVHTSFTVGPQSKCVYILVPPSVVRSVPREPTFKQLLTEAASDPGSLSSLCQKLGEFSAKWGDRSIKFGDEAHAIDLLCALFSHLLTNSDRKSPEPSVITTKNALFCKIAFCLARAFDLFVRDNGVNDNSDSDDENNNVYKHKSAVEIFSSEKLLEIVTVHGRRNYLHETLVSSNGTPIVMVLGVPNMTRVV